MITMFCVFLAASQLPVACLGNLHDCRVRAAITSRPGSPARCIRTQQPYYLEYQHGR
jgi:hypothetical protein